MFYTEDTATQENTDDHDECLLILDGTARLDYANENPIQIKDKTVIETVTQFFGFFRKNKNSFKWEII